MISYSTFDSKLKPAITGATTATIDSLATFGKAMADSLLSGGEISQDQHEIVYHNIDGWRTAFLNGTTPPDWEVPL